MDIGEYSFDIYKNQLRRSLAKAGITTEKQINYSQALSLLKAIDYLKDDVVVKLY